MSPDLNEREQQVLSLMCDGLNRPAIAERLALSPSSIAAYTTRIFTKLCVRNTRQAVEYAFRYGLAKIHKEQP